MRAVLVQCPVWGTREPPFAPVQLSACLRNAGHEARSFDLNNRLYRARNAGTRNLWAWEQSGFWYDPSRVAEFFREHSAELESFAGEVLANDPAVAGFSVAASTREATLAFARLLKRRKPGLTVVLGGTLFMDERFVETALREGCVDFVITGEGDVTLPELLGLLERGGDPADCSGVSFLRGGALLRSAERARLENLDSLPYMDLADLRIGDYDDTVHIAFLSSRGCVWRCRFCSSCAFWGPYRQMSAERMHQEITFHKILHPRAGHIDFHDLVFNADVERVRGFCELMVRYPPPGIRMQWLANAIVNPKMTRELFELMAAAGCRKLIFGIESGSQRVLELMGKHFKVEDARRLIRGAAEAGIAVTANFMFGFPGETEEDFALTLAFLRETAPYLERVYPSRTYCALEEHSYLHGHPGEFGVRMPCSHHLYWETVDGSNTYPLRLKRCQRFEESCRELGVRVDGGVQTDVQLDEWFSLAQYHEHRGELAPALDYLLKYRERDPEDRVVNGKIAELRSRMHG